MSLHWYACISINTYCYVIYHISLEMVWWALFNAYSIMRIHLVIHEILANEDFTVTDDLISQLFVVAFVYPTYLQIALQCNLVCENWSTGCEDTSWIKFVTSTLLRLYSFSEVIILWQTDGIVYKLKLRSF